LRWPIALGKPQRRFSSLGLGRLLQQPLKIELVMDAPLPVAAWWMLGGIKDAHCG